MRDAGRRRRRGDEATMCWPCGKKEGGTEAERKCQICGEKGRDAGTQGLRHRTRLPGTCAQYVGAVHYGKKCRGCE